MYGNKPIALFGVGFCGEKFYYANHKKENIKICFDNFNYGTKFYGLAVLSPEPQKIREYFVIITVEDYRPVRDQLTEYGLKEFEDFIGWEFYHKKVALIHGNCYRRIWDQCINSSTDFRETYTIYDNPQIHINPQKVVNSAALRHCDLLVTQDIQKNNQFGYQLSFDYLKEQVPSGCKVVVVPNLVGLGGGFFPQYKIIENLERRRVCPVADVNLDRLVLGGVEYARIEKELQGDVYQKDFILQNFNGYIDKMREREAGWDIKIVDYILGNYKKKKVFYDIYHPTNAVLEEIVRRLLLFLGMNADFEHADDEISEEEMLIYPCVKRALGIQWDIEYIRNNPIHRLTSGKMDMLQYIKEYIYWNHNGAPGYDS